MIHLEHICKSYKKTKALVDFNMVFENKIYGLLGPNGSGKTTLFRIMTRLIRADKGRIYVNGEAVKQRLNIGYLPQKFGLIPELKLEQHLYYFADLKKIAKPEQKQEVARVLQLVGLTDKAKKKCASLSGGMVRRAGIAQALLGQPNLILMDEATVGLDPEERLRFKLILSDMSQSCPIILATHIVEDVDALCEEVIVLKEGHILAQASLLDLALSASDKVLVLKHKDLTQLNLQHRLVRLYTDHAKKDKMVRVLLREALDSDSQEASELRRQIEGLQWAYPKLEDGYLSITST